MITIEKPWGKEEILENNGRYVVKKLYINAGHKCSLQYHNEKHETMCMLSGEARFLVGDSADALQEMIMKPGDYIVIPPLKIHRMEAITDIVFLEASTCELHDVVRLEDSYGRNDK